MLYRCPERGENSWVYTGKSKQNGFMLKRVRSWRAVGLGAILVGLLVFVAAISVRAIGADDALFNRLVGWANILAAGLALLGVWLVVRPPRSGERPTAELADDLAGQVLEIEGRARSELLFAGLDPGRSANLTFYPDVVYGSASARGDLEGVARFFEEETTGRVVILGSPGAGKTVLALTLICQLAQTRQGLDQAARQQTPVPVRFDLAGWDTTKSLNEWLVTALTSRYSNLTPAQAKQLLDQHLVLPVLDGLDEMDPADAEPTRAHAAVIHLNRHLTGTDLLPVVVTCREQPYQRIGIEVADAVPVRITP